MLDLHSDRTYYRAPELSAGLLSAHLWLEGDIPLRMTHKVIDSTVYFPLGFDPKEEKKERERKERKVSVGWCRHANQGDRGRRLSLPHIY